MSHAVVVSAARLFAESGIPVFRFDYSGCGDSEGDLRFVTLEDWQQDIDSAIEVFRREAGVSQCILWGLRLGGGLALMRQQSGNDIAGLVLWQPVLNFSVHIKQFLRRAISSQISKVSSGNSDSIVEDDLQQYGFTHVIGYPVSKGLCDSFNKVGGQPANIVPAVPAFILSISLMDEPVADLCRYAKRVKDAGATVSMEHVNAEPFWDRYWQWECKLIAIATLRWLQELI